MKSKLDNFKTVILANISTAAQNGDVDLVSRQSSKLVKVRELIMAYERIEHEYETLRSGMNLGFGDQQKHVLHDLEHSCPTNPRSSQSVLEIIIDWEANSQPYGRETFCERKATATVAKLIERLYEVMGQRVLEEGCRMRISRGPFLSKYPKSDFLNQSKKEPYQHQPIASTGYYVLTHSSTKQKVEDITNYLKRLGLNPKSFEVRAVSK